MRAIVSISILIFLSPVISFSQIDSSVMFEKAKGTLDHPVNHYVRLITYDSLQRNIFGCDPIPSNTYYLVSKDSVKSVFDGNVVTIYFDRGIYFIIVKTGCYYCIYSGIEKTNLIIGEPVKQGQYLGIVAENNFHEYTLQFMIATKDGYIDPDAWFRRCCCSQQISCTESENNAANFNTILRCR